MTKQRVERLTDIMARVLHYQDSGEPDWATMDYAAMKREYDELPKAIIDRYRNDAKFHAQVDRAVATVLELDRSAAEPHNVEGMYPPDEPSDEFEKWWAAEPEAWNDAKSLARLAWNAALTGVPAFHPPESATPRNLADRYQLTDRLRDVLAKALNCSPDSVTPEMASRLQRRQLLELSGCGPADARAIRNWLVANGFHWGERKAGQFRQEQL